MEQRFSRLMALPDVRVVRPVNRAQRSFPPYAALELFPGLSRERFFDRVGTPASEKGADDNEESDRESLQAQTILKKVTGDKWPVTSFKIRRFADLSLHVTWHTAHDTFPND